MGLDRLRGGGHAFPLGGGGDRDPTRSYTRFDGLSTPQWLRDVASLITICVELSFPVAPRLDPLHYDLEPPCWRDVEQLGRFIDGGPFVRCFDRAEVPIFHTAIINAPAGHGSI
jgi:hypothetical protein